jgi:RNA polymerase sigma factor (sigma-70 family)
VSHEERVLRDTLDLVRSDSELLEQWRAGSRQAGNELFQRYFEAVRRFFVNKVRPDVLGDVVQTTFERVSKGRDRFEGRSSFRTYLFAVAHNVLREHYRDKYRKVNADIDEQSVLDLGAGPSTMLSAHREQRVLLEGLRRLPLESQVLLELYYWEKLTGPQLGEVLGVPENTARSRLRRAKLLLEQAIVQVAGSPEVLESTTMDLDRWAAEVPASMKEHDGAFAAEPDQSSKSSSSKGDETSS